MSLFRLFRRSRRPEVRPMLPKRWRTRLNFESLEDRRTPAAFLSGGTLVIDGTAGADDAELHDTTLNGQAAVRVTLNGVDSTFTTASVTTGIVRFNGFAGDDWFFHDSALRSQAYMGDGNDWAWTSAQNDVVYGGAGNDTCYGYTGNDSLTGGDGNDSVYAEDGNDTASGGAGNDWVYGGAGADNVSGDDGADFLYGDAGNDVVAGGNGDDVVSGDDNDDSVYGGAGNDVVNAGNGNDRAYGDAGNDWVRGATGADSVYGGDQNDSLFGDAGNDSVYGGYGDDELFGGTETDALYGEGDSDWLEAGSASEYADGGAGTDWNAHVWAVNGATITDVNQMGSGTCSFLSSLSGATQYSNLVNNITYLGNYTYGVAFFQDGVGWVTEQVRFDGSIVSAWVDTDKNGTLDTFRRMDPSEAVEGESWVIVYQRAYLEHFHGIDSLNGAQVAAFAGEWPDVPMKAITGKAVSNFNTGSLNQWQARDLAWTRTATACDNQHCYMLYDVYTDAGGNWVVTLFNPWGVDATHETGLTFANDGSNDGFITASWSVFQNNLTKVYATNS